MRQETGFVETSSLEKPSTDSNFILVVNEWTAPLVPFSALSEFIVEHAVLLAPVLVLKDDVDAPVLCISDGLPAKNYCDPETFQCLEARLLQIGRAHV